MNGNWGPWKPWTNCSETCGIVGFKYRSRQCDSPSPVYGGEYCQAKPMEVKLCWEADNANNDICSSKSVFCQNKSLFSVLELIDGLLITKSGKYSYQLPEDTVSQLYLFLVWQILL